MTTNLKILALDTSTEACSVAIRQGETVLERFELGTPHSERILFLVDELLGETGLALTQLDAIAFGRGPGSFTGLRIGAGVAQGLAFGAGVPVIPVSSLAALAQGVDAPRVLAAFDARMNQVYIGAYARNAAGIVELAGSEDVAAPRDAPLPSGSGWVGAGSGWDRYHDELLQRLGERVASWHERGYPRASDVARLGVALLRAGGAIPAERALPVYVRDEVAVKQTKP